MTFLIILCRAGRSSGQRVISGEHPHRAPKSTPSTVCRLGSGTSSQTRLGYNLWVPEQTVFRSFSTQVESDPRVEEGKSEETSIAETEADDQTDELDIGKAVEGELQQSGSGYEEWDQERIKSQQALWKKIDGMKQGPQKSVVPMILEWLNEGYTLDKRVLVTILIRLRRRQRYKQAMEISDWMSEEEDIKWELADNIVRIDLKAKMKQFTVAEQLLENSPPEFKTELAYHTLLKNYADHQMAHKAEALLEKLKSTGLLTLPFSFNQMMLLYKRKGMEHKLPEVLEEMKALGVPKDVYTYNILMDVKARSGDIEGMEKIFAELNADENVKADAATFGTLATSCVHAGLLDKAKGYLKEMEQGEVFRNRSAYDILISQYGAVGDLEGVERVWEKVKTGPIVTNRSYITVIEAFGKLGMVEKAEELYEVMSKSKGLILSRQFNALLSAYSRKGLMDKAEKLIETMDKLGRKKNAITYHHLVTGYLKTDQLDKALAAMKEAQGDPKQGRSKPWFETLVAVLDAFAERGNVVNAEKQFQDIKKAYPRPNIQVYNILLKAYINSRVPALGFLQRMSADRLVPNEETLSLLRQQTGVREETQAAVDAFSQPEVAA
ncbi:hypothetical protein KC19_N017400 [Ceratodon purpureus]|nr:hypothetical protein KC19_N017400 [Ceratodon purpureus]